MDDYKIEQADLRTYVDQYDDEVARKKQRRFFIEAGYEMLPEILDDLLIKTRPDSASDNFSEGMGFPEIEQLLQQWSSSEISAAEARRLLNGLYRSPAVFQRFLVKLNQIALVIDSQSAVELDEVQIKSTAEILNMLGVTKQKPLPEKYNFAIKVSKILSRLKESLAKPQRLQPRLFPRISVVVATLLVFIMAGYFGFNYYYSSYIPALAQDMLRQNYRVHIENEPRPSGGFASTGIGQLMGGEDADKAYLLKAGALCRQVLQHQPQSTSGKEVLAKIFYIEGNYTAADSILQQINGSEIQQSAALLNDLGVLKFKQKKMLKAISFFKAALAQDSTLKEVYYNLGLVYLQSDSLKQAKKYLKVFLHLEKDTQWFNAAKKMLQPIED